MANVNKNLVTHGFEQKLQQVKAGVEKHLSATAPMELVGKQTTVGEVVADFDAILARYQRVRDAAAALAQERKQLYDSLPAGHEEYLAFKRVLQAKLGGTHPQLGDFGLPFGARKPRSSETLVLAAAKARETRRIRTHARAQAKTCAQREGADGRHPRSRWEADVRDFERDRFSGDPSPCPLPCRREENVRDPDPDPDVDWDRDPDRPVEASLGLSPRGRRVSP